MELQLEGIVRELLPLQEGDGRNGRWRKQQFILETQGGQYPRQVCIMVWGDKIDQFSLHIGDNITASIDIESREYNGRWYTDVKVWKVEKKTAGAPAPTSVDHDEEPYPPLGSATEPVQNNDPFTSTDEGDDLPF